MSVSVYAKLLNDFTPFKNKVGNTFRSNNIEYQRMREIVEMELEKERKILSEIENLERELYHYQNLCATKKQGGNIKKEEQEQELKLKQIHIQSSELDRKINNNAQEIADLRTEYARLQKNIDDAINKHQFEMKQELKENVEENTIRDSLEIKRQMNEIKNLEEILNQRKIQIKETDDYLFDEFGADRSKLFDHLIEKDSDDVKYDDPTHHVLSMFMNFPS